ncbi:hypothetical protein ACFL5H_03100 [Candidatus Latescibacterota bacterium]
MKTIRVLLLLVLVAAFGSGCATSSYFSKLPTQQDFTKSSLQLKQEYPDLTRYESPGIFVKYNMPEAETLKNTWGEPHSTGFCARMLWPPAWLFHPMNYWYWEFDGKKVSALIDRPMLFLYQPHVFKLTVEDSEK